MTINQQYKFYISLPSGEVQFYPANNSLKWKNAAYDDEFFFRETLETSLNICDKDLFNELWELEKDDCACNYLDMRIEERCCLSDPFIQVWTGKFSFPEGEWNPEDCQVTFKPRTEDVYSCMINNWERKKNFLDIEERVTIKTLEGEVVCTTNSNNNQIPNPPSGYGWVITKITYELEEEFVNGDSIGVIYQNYTVEWCRQCFTGSQPSPSWQFENGKWYNSISVIAPVTQSSVSGGPDQDATDEPYVLTVRRVTTYGILDLTADNGITLKDFIEFFLSDCFDCVRSNFLNINADNTEFTNFEYECAKKEYHDIVLFQSSDIINPDGVNASSGNINQKAGLKCFKDFWKAIRDMLDLIMFYDEQSGCLRIEHSSYPVGNGQILDLFAFYPRCLSGKGNYSYDSDDIPASESLIYSNENHDQDFIEGIIEYDQDCSSNEPGKDQEKNIDCFSNDIGQIYDNDDLKDDTQALNNITLVSTTDGVINYSIGDISGQAKLNGPFALSNIIKKYHLRNRPQCAGTINGTFTNLTKKKTRTQDGITVEGFDCSHYRALNPQLDLVRTQFAETCIESIEYEAPGRKLDLELKF